MSQEGEDLTGYRIEIWYQVSWPNLNLNATPHSQPPEKDYYTNETQAQKGAGEMGYVKSILVATKNGKDGFVVGRNVKLSSD